MKLSRADVTARVADFTIRCRQAGMNLTPQRLAIYRALVEARDHPSPEALFASVKPGMPTLSLGTLYKTLGTLTAMGLVAELPATGDSRRYDANMQPHHHLVCTGCDTVADYHDPALDHIAPRTAPPDFQVSQVSVHIHGRCGACVAADRAVPSVV